MKQDFLVKLRSGEPLSFREQILVVLQLSFPAIMAQISSIVMQYIDASMVGQLGANDSASIGLVSTSTWLFGGLCSSIVTGFTVQIAHRIGAGEDRTARDIMRQAFVVVLAFSSFMAAIGAAISGFLPQWLGGNADICRNASLYFLVHCLSLPISQLNGLAGGMLQASGNMKVPSILHIMMCGLDVIFNFFFIFSDKEIFGIPMPGMGLGVIGAALGTTAANFVTALFMMYFLFVRSPMLHLRKGEKFRFSKEYLKRGIKIALPLSVEQIIGTGAQITSTRIVAPLGTVAIAANSFSVTAESLCYMPGYGIGTAATTLIGQSIGAGRKDLTRRLGWLTTLMGVGIMTLSGIVLYVAAPWMIGFLSPDPAVVALGTVVLRIEAFAEPLYGASIVACGVFRGAGDTLIPSCLNFFTMWAVRLPIAAFLAPRIGLKGVWIAMCLELCVRGILFLIRLAGKRWQKSAAVKTETSADEEAEA